MPILQQLGIFISPRIEPPLNDPCFLEAPVDHKAWTVVPEPHVGVIPDLEVNLRELYAGSLQERTDLLSNVIVSNRETNLFAFGEFLNDSYVLLFDFFHALRKRHRIVRPGK